MHGCKHKYQVLEWRVGASTSTKYTSGGWRATSDAWRVASYELRATSPQASCAANFIAEHLHKEYKGGWLHADIAGPAHIEERGTGFGVALVLAMLGVDGFAP